MIAVERRVESIRQQVLRECPLPAPAREPDDELAYALYWLLRTMDGIQVCVGGWKYFHVIRESDESLKAVGLMMLLPDGTIPIEIEVNAHDDGFTWTVQVGQADSAWLALSNAKRWGRMYLYATGERATPEWSCGETYQGSADRANA